MQWFEIKTEFRSSLQSAGLDSFEALVARPIGETVVLDKEGCQVRRISLKHDGEDKTFYLKRIALESRIKAMRMAIYGRRPRSGAIREQMMLSHLNAAGFATMGAVAWGEERLFGIPLRGFLLVEAVEGSELSSLFKRGERKQREQLARAAGGLLGRLHGSGFYQAVRFKDVFAKGAAHTLSASDLVLIDRETSKPWPSPFFTYYCFRSLKRIHRRNIRDGIRFNDTELKLFADAYVEALRPRRELSVETLLKRVFGKNALNPAADC